MNDKNNSKRWQRQTLIPTSRIPTVRMLDMVMPLASAPDRTKTPASQAVTDRLPVLA